MTIARGFLGLLEYPTEDVIRAARELGYIHDVVVPGSGSVTLSAKLGDLNVTARKGTTNPYTEIAELCEEYARERKERRS